MRARGPLRLTLHAFVNDRDLHALDACRRLDDGRRPIAGRVRVVPVAGAPAIALRADRGTRAAEHVWYRNFDYPVERERGLDDCEDHLRVATFDADLRRARR